VFFVLSAEEGRHTSTQFKGDEENMAGKVVIPWELKYKFAFGAWTSILKGFMYAIRKKYGAAAALEIYEMVAKMDDRIKNMTQILKDVFKIEGNDMVAMQKWWDIWYELTGIEVTWLERSKTCNRNKITKCPFKMESKDLSDWDLTIFTNVVTKALNPKATTEQHKNMCAGDPYCEFVTRIEE